MGRRLTEPQRRMLRDVVDAGEKKYNGRAARTIKALEAAGLVECDFDLRPHSKGSGLSFTEVWTVRPTDAGREVFGG